MRGRLLLLTNHRQFWALTPCSFFIRHLQSYSLQLSTQQIVQRRRDYISFSIHYGDYLSYDDILKMHSCWSRFPWYFFIIIVTIDSELPPSSILTPSLKIGIDPANQLVGDLTVRKVDGDEVMSRLSAGLDMWGSAGNGEERETLMIE
jgi:hypothetical protein